MLDDSMLANIRNTFASAVQRIYVPSLGKTFSFREVSVKEHKTLSKIVISNRDTQSVVYAATLAMIRNLCLEDDFDPYKMSEFDRLRIIVYLFSNNFFSKNLSIRCPRAACAESIKYPIQYGSLLKMMDSMDCSDIVFENENHIGNVRVISGFPTTARYLSLLEAVDGINDRNLYGNMQTPTTYEDMDKAFSEINDAPQSNSQIDMDVINKIRKRREVLKGNIKKVVEEKKDVFGNVELKTVNSKSEMLDVADLYLKHIDVPKISGSENQLSINMTDFDYEDTEKILSVLPMGLFIREDGSNIIKHTTNELFRRMNACVPKIVCPKCGYEISKRLTLPNFFIFG